LAQATRSLAFCTGSDWCTVSTKGPRAASVTTAKGAALPVDHALSSVGSVLFDAVYVPDVAKPPAEADPDALLVAEHDGREVLADGDPALVATVP